MKYPPRSVKIGEDEDILYWLLDAANRSNFSDLSFIREFLCYEYKGRSETIPIAKNLEMLNEKGISIIPEVMEILKKHTIYYTLIPFVSKKVTAGNMEYLLRHPKNTLPTLRVEKPSQDIYCPLCVKEDQEKYGRIIVHVPHEFQVHACHKHGCKLQETPDSTMVEEADEESIRNARFVYSLYKEPITYSLDEYVESLVSAIKTDTKKDQEWKRAFIKKCRQLARCKYISKNAADELMEYFENPEALRTFITVHAESDLNDRFYEIEADGAIRILSINYPLAYVECKCGCKYHTHMYARTQFNNCPICGRHVQKEDMIKDILKDTEFEFAKTISNGRTCLKHAPCGREMVIFTRQLFFGEGPKCLECEQERRYRQRVGEEKLNIYGKKMKVIKSDNNIYVDVEFEDGTVVRKIQYWKFQAGQIYENSIQTSVPDQTGLRVMNRQGHMAEITSMNHEKDISVRFPSGHEVHHEMLLSFMSGFILDDTADELPDINELIGKQAKQSNGAVATIISVNDFIDINVQMGKHTLNHVRYQDFLEGSLKEHSGFSEENYKKKHVGERMIATSGMMFEVIDHANADKRNGYIVRFEDGKIPEHEYDHDILRWGRVRHPDMVISLGKYYTKGIDRTGEEHIQADGKMARVVEWIDEKNMIVEFPNGKRRRSDYWSFSHGKLTESSRTVKNLNVKSRKGVGLSLQQKNGLNATIIDDSGKKGITVKFENGCIRRGIKFNTFASGHVGLIPSKLRVERVGETVYQEQLGMNAIITSYRGCHDISIRLENGEIREHVNYRMFVNGWITWDYKSNSNVIRASFERKENKKGQKVYQIKCGMVAEIIEYRDCKHVDIIFEDGSIRKNVYYYKFKKGLIAARDQEECKKGRIGMTVKQRCGIDATIVEYYDARNLVICFSDGSIRENVTYSEFIMGGVSSKPKEKKVKDRIGKRRIMNNGQEAEIISMVNSKNCTVRFHDGTIRENVSYFSFIHGKVSPNHQVRNMDKKTKNERVGMIVEQRNGLSAEVIEYKSSTNMTVRFSNGVIREQVCYKYFIRGELEPISRNNVMDKYLGMEVLQKCGLNAKIIAARRYTDIDIEYENGERRLNVSVKDFIAGHLRSPSKRK